MSILVDLGDPFICKIETNTITIRTRQWISDTHEHTHSSNGGWDWMHRAPETPETDYITPKQRV